MSFTPISSDPVADSSGLQNVAVTKSSPGTFDSVLSGLSAAAYYSGDTVNAFTATYGSDTLASISALTSNAVYNSAGTAAALSTSATGGGIGNSTYLTGGYTGSSLGSSPYLTGGSTDSLSTLANEVGPDMSEMIALQLYIQKETTFFGAQTNIIKAKGDAEKSAVANMK